MNLIKQMFARYINRAQDEGGWLQAVPYALQGISALGGIFGNKKKFIDPDMMRQKYGPAAVGRDAQIMANQILNSPYGQQLLASAATSGQEMQTDMATRAAASGMDPSTGGESGASTFAAAAAPQAQAGLERGVRADVWKAAMPLAASQNQGMMEMDLASQNDRNSRPNAWQQVGSAAATAASMFPAKKKA